MRESALRRKIREYLNTVPSLWQVPVVGTRWGKRGAPDIICCYLGYFIGIETKSPGGKPTPLQIYEGGKIQKSGGHYLLTSKLEEVKTLIQEIGNAEE